MLAAKLNVGPCENLHQCVLIIINKYNDDAASTIWIALHWVESIVSKVMSHEDENMETIQYSLMRYLNAPE